DMFRAQKEYYMEPDVFPHFLRGKGFGNLTPVSALVRLVADLIVLWIGLAAGFSSMYRLNQSKVSCEFDPILVFLGWPESTPFRTLTIREPYVKRLSLGRAIWVTTLVPTCVVVLTLLFL
ncbi:uncharacterized protein EDB93DRAFT_1059754, partial [Suillus bovinus]|uniref:uncharacterized protein n=1 Tax=Suillus bovinus TaxID=48563 RepID=UPI001B871BC0